MLNAQRPKLHAGRPWRLTRGIGHLVLSMVVAGCAARRIPIPTDPGEPLPDFTKIHTQVASACAGIRTLEAELGLSGHAGEQSLRGTVVAGFQRPASMRLDGVAPFGAPAFVLAARGETAILVLPRESPVRVVRGAAAEAILGALTGVTLAPADLQAILTGSVTPAPRATAGRLHRNGWASIDLEGGATLFLQRAGNSWRVRAARRDGWQIEYPAWPGAFPQSVRLRSDGQALDVDMTATIMQLEANVPLDETTFAIDVPRDALPLSIEELRQSGPLRER